MKKFLTSIILLAAVFLPMSQIFAGSSVNEDLTRLEQLVITAAESLRLDPENGSRRINQQQFLFAAEHKLKMAQVFFNWHDFLDEDLRDLGLYLLAIDFRQPIAARTVLLRQLQLCREPVLQQWLNQRLEQLKQLSTLNIHHRKWQNTTIAGELKTLKDKLQIYGR